MIYFPKSNQSQIRVKIIDNNDSYHVNIDLLISQKLKSSTIMMNITFKSIDLLPKVKSKSKSCIILIHIILLLIDWFPRVESKSKVKKIDRFEMIAENQWPFTCKAIDSNNNHLYWFDLMFSRLLLPFLTLLLPSKKNIQLYHILKIIF